MIPPREAKPGEAEWIQYRNAWRVYLRAQRSLVNIQKELAVLAADGRRIASEIPVLREDMLKAREAYFRWLDTSR